MCLAGFLGEVTNPLNILRKNYALEGKKEKSLTVSYMFCGLFILARVIICPFVIKSAQYTDNVWDPLIFKIFAGGLWMISLIWVFMIFNLSSKQLAEVIFNLDYSCLTF